MLLPYLMALVVTEYVWYMHDMGWGTRKLWRRLGCHVTEQAFWSLAPKMGLLLLLLWLIHHTWFERFMEIASLKYPALGIKGHHQGATSFRRHLEGLISARKSRKPSGAGLSGDASGEKATLRKRIVSWMYDHVESAIEVCHVTETPAAPVESKQSVATPQAARGWTHPADTSRTNLASALGLLSRWRLSNPRRPTPRQLCVACGRIAHFLWSPHPSACLSGVGGQGADLIVKVQHAMAQRGDVGHVGRSGGAGAVARGCVPVWYERHLPVLRHLLHLQPQGRGTSRKAKLGQEITRLWHGPDMTLFPLVQTHLPTRRSPSMQMQRQWLIKFLWYLNVSIVARCVAIARPFALPPTTRPH